MTRRIDTACGRVRREVNELMESVAERVVHAPTEHLTFADEALTLLASDISVLQLHVAGQLQLRNALPALDPDLWDVELVHETSSGQSRVEAFVDGQYVGAHLCGVECVGAEDGHAEDAARAIAAQHIIKKGATTS